MNFTLSFTAVDGVELTPAIASAALAGVRAALEDGDTAGSVYDINGNRVGAWEIS